MNQSPARMHFLAMRYMRDRNAMARLARRLDIAESKMAELDQDVLEARLGVGPALAKEKTDG